MLSRNNSHSALGEGSRFRSYLVAGTIEFGFQSHFGPKRTPAMDSPRKVALGTPQPVWVLDQCLRSLWWSKVSGWNNRFWDPEPVWAKTDPGNGFSSQTTPCDAVAHLAARSIPEEFMIHIRCLGTCVFFSRKIGHF